jgi:Ras-related protein Rab-2A
MAGPSWNYVLKFIITGAVLLLDYSTHLQLTLPLTGDAGVGKSSLLVRLTDQRFLANPDPTVRSPLFTLICTIHTPFLSLASSLAQS